MREKQLINIIKEETNSKYIGDDCAYIKNFGITVTQDNLVEDIHFSLRYASAYQIGWKSAAVNISDICASGAKPEYLTIGLSLPNYVDEKFVKEFYEGAKDAAKDAEIIGGDITGSDKLFISITAIGSDKGRKISSRSNAKKGYKVIVSGEHGNSAMGLKLLSENKLEKNIFTDSHLMPKAQIKFSKEIAENIDCDYAMMDTSDGLADALYQIALASDVKISIDTLKIPHNSLVSMEQVLYGGEDYQLIACVPEKILNKITNYYIIGEVISDGFGLEIDKKSINNVDDKIFNHFGKN